MNSRIDHIVIGAANLISGTKILETKINTKFSPGGEHQIMGTHNKLLKLQSDIYLEVIANNQNADKPSRQRWFSLDESSIKDKIKDSPRAYVGYLKLMILKTQLKNVVIIQVRYFNYHEMT